jgi:hypothetical protein
VHILNQENPVSGFDTFGEKLIVPGSGFLGEGGEVSELIRRFEFPSVSPSSGY